MNNLKEKLIEEIKIILIEKDIKYFYLNNNFFFDNNVSDLLNVNLLYLQYFKWKIKI